MSDPPCRHCNEWRIAACPACRGYADTRTDCIVCGGDGCLPCPLCAVDKTYEPACQDVWQLRMGQPALDTRTGRIGVVGVVITARPDQFRFHFPPFPDPVTVVWLWPRDDACGRPWMTFAERLAAPRGDGGNA